MFDMNDPPSNYNKRETESFKKSDDNLSSYNSKENVNNFDKRGNFSSFSSGEKSSREIFKFDNEFGDDDYKGNSSRSRSRSSSSNINNNCNKNSNVNNNSNNNCIINKNNDYLEDAYRFHKINTDKEEEKPFNINNCEFFLTGDEIRSSNLSSDFRKANNKKFSSNKYKIKKNTHEENIREEGISCTLRDFTSLKDNTFYDNSSVNNSLNLTKNDIMYNCREGKGMMTMMMNKNFSEDTVSKTNLKLSMSNVCTSGVDSDRIRGGNHINVAPHTSGTTHLSTTTQISGSTHASGGSGGFHDDSSFYKTGKVRSDRGKMQKKGNFGCNLKKATSSKGNNLNENMFFSEMTRKSLDINEKCINNNTKIKIKRLCEKIEGFEKEIKNEILQKKNVEKEKIYVIREAINKLEKNLNSEIKKRIEHNRNIQSIFSSEILKVQEKIENVVNDKVSEIENAIKVLNDKINTISDNIENEKIKCIQNLEKKNSSIAKEFSNLQSAFQREKISNKEKENNICKKLEEIEKKSESKIATEKNIRDSKYQEIISYIEEIKRERKGKNENFQNFVMEEIATVKNGLILESQAREAADDDIVQAVNHYTKALQDSLRLINSN
ncbi:SF-assemblin [Plasmodium gonderi]|uniref:SF-assemblin n=1 Tax=Plasmodium gonderi TaxID=77519 RepID=A0A1Y1JE26_PLAGO|nr:SF-assemblin [Plasmodium gonderi]GAW79002.1 SF-assemblin [Plasmodium gonderi]